MSESRFSARPIGLAILATMLTPLDPVLFGEAQTGQPAWLTTH